MTFSAQAKKGTAFCCSPPFVSSSIQFYVYNISVTPATLLFFTNKMVLYQRDIVPLCFHIGTLDKAGAYGAQGYASLFVEGLEGDFFNVMGLPLCALGTMLKELGVNLL